LKKYIAELHSHSTCSDGFLSPEKIPSFAKKKGLDIIAVTDHNTIEGGIRAMNAYNKDDVYVIPGIEVSVSNAHILGYFVTQNIKSKNFKDVIKEIKDQGGIAVWAHPVRYPFLGTIRGKKPFIPKPDELVLFDAVEVFNSRNSKKANLKIFDICKNNGIFSYTAGSDAHFPFELGFAKTVFELEKLNESEIKNAFKSGRVFLSKDLKTCRLCYFLTGIMNRITGKKY